MNKLWDLATINELEKRIKDTDKYELHNYVLDLLKNMKNEEIQ